MIMELHECECLKTLMKRIVRHQTIDDSVLTSINVVINIAIKLTSQVAYKRKGRLPIQT